MARRNGATEAMPAVHNPSTTSTNSAVSAVLPGGSMNQGARPHTVLLMATSRT